MHGESWRSRRIGTATAGGWTAPAERRSPIRPIRCHQVGSSVVCLVVDDESLRETTSGPNGNAFGAGVGGNLLKTSSVASFPLSPTCFTFAPACRPTGWPRALGCRSLSPPSLSWPADSSATCSILVRLRRPDPTTVSRPRRTERTPAIGPGLLRLRQIRGHQHRRRRQHPMPTGRAGSVRSSSRSLVLASSSAMRVLAGCSGPVIPRPHQHRSRFDRLLGLRRLRRNGGVGLPGRPRTAGPMEVHADGDTTK